MRIVVDNATGAVLMWSETGFPTAGEGQTAMDLTPDMEAAFRAVDAPDGVLFDGQGFTASPPPPPMVPATATSGDFVSALIDLGWYDAVEQAVTAAGGRVLVLWKHASVFERYNPRLIALARAIGKTDADLDELFLKTRDYA